MTVSLFWFFFMSNIVLTFGSFRKFLRCDSSILTFWGSSLTRCHLVFLQNEIWHVFLQYRFYRSRYWKGYIINSITCNGGKEWAFLLSLREDSKAVGCTLFVNKIWQYSIKKQDTLIHRVGEQILMHPKTLFSKYV